jgi:ABC-type polysaccharide/polyol phosphate export permease
MDTSREDAPREAPASLRSTAVRPGPIGLVTEAIRETWSRRRLIRYLVQADLKKKGSDTVLGNIWWVLDPLLQMVVYVILVSIIFQRTTPDYPLFIFAAILPWKWFTSSVYDAITSVVGQERLIKQIQFPKIILPTATTFAGIANFAFGLIPLVGLLVFFYSDRISPYLVFIPVIAFVQFVFTLAFSFVVSGINVFFRDIANVSRHALRLWFYLSPALYSSTAIDALGEKAPIVAQLMRINPFYTFFESYRNVIYGTPEGAPAMPLWGPLAIWLGLSVLFLALGTLFFKRLEPAFAKVL